MSSVDLWGFGFGSVSVGVLPRYLFRARGEMVAAFGFCLSLFLPSLLSPPSLLHAGPGSHSFLLFRVLAGLPSASSTGRSGAAFGCRSFCLLSLPGPAALVAPSCATPRDYLSDTPLLRAMGFLVSQHGQLGAIPPPPFLSISPLESTRSGGAIHPLPNNISAMPVRYPMKTRQVGAEPPSAILSRKGIARYGGVSRTGPLSRLPFRLSSFPSFCLPSFPSLSFSFASAALERVTFWPALRKVLVLDQTAHSFPS